MKKITKTAVGKLLPRRTPQSHKMTNGYVSIVAGSTHFPGTVRLTAHAAARAGAGGVCMLFPQSIRPDIGDIIAEALWFPLKEHGNELSLASAFAIYREGIIRSQAVLIGCGMGRLPTTQEFIRECLAHTSLPMVVDADALFALQGQGEFITKFSNKQWLLTPHQGEWQYLLSSHEWDPDTDPAQVAKEWGCTLLIKGFPTRIYTPTGDVFENPTGNPAATTAGCGDVLSAICAAFLAQGLGVGEAAQAAIFVAGQAADEYVQATGSYSLMASDIINQLPKTIGKLIG